MRISEQIRAELQKNEKLSEDFPDVWEMLQEAADLLDTYYIQTKAISISGRLGEAKMLSRTALKEDA